jgi:CheY-like chemotaxis protein
MPADPDRSGLGVARRAAMPRVLWIEADATHALLLRLTMHSLGVLAEFETIRDGRHAIERLRALSVAPPPERPALLVLDCEQLEGEACQMLDFRDSQPTLRHTPTVVLASDPETVQRANADLDATSFEPRPVTLAQIKQLAGRLSEVLSTRSFCN